MLNVVVSGIVTGLLYGVAGLALVIVYRTSKVLNFALGGLGAVAAYSVSSLLNLRLPYPVSFVIGVAVGALVGLILELGIVRPLRRKPHLTIGIGTLGALLISQGALGARFGYSPEALPEALAGAGAFRLGTFGISANQILIIVVALLVTLALFLLIGKTRLGLTMRATSSGPQTAELLGVDVARVRSVAWMIGGAYGALAALLVTPLTYLSPTSFTDFMLTAFAAVVLGGFTSIAGVVVGALAFGVAINLLETFLSPTLIDTYTFIGIAIVLVLRPNGLFGRREHEIPEPQVTAIGSGGTVEQERSPAEVRGAGSIRPRARLGALRGSWSQWVVLLLVMALMPVVLDPPTIFLLITALATFIGVLGLNILVGYTGQVSLGHSGFLAIGAVAAGVAIKHGMSPLLTLPLALVLGAAAGLIIGLPAERLSGIYLVLLTLAFSFAVPELDLQFGSVTGGANGLPLALPPALATTVPEYWFVLAVAALVTGVTLVASVSRIGRGWRAVRDSEHGALAMGLNPTVIKLGAFAWSSALAALSGALLGMIVGFVTPASYGVLISIYALLAVVLGGTGSIFGSLIGALFLSAVPKYTQGLGLPQDLVFGFALILVLVLAPSGVAGLLERARAGTIRRLARRRGGAAAPEVPDLAEEGPEPPRLDHAGAPAAGGSDARGHPDALLELQAVSAGYGLVDVLHEVSIHVSPGEVVAIIGANGVGKSTLMRTISGLIRPTQGRVLLRGHAVSRRTDPHSIARLGIGHVPEGRAIFPDLSVAENLEMGTFGRAGRPGGMATEAVLDFFPILRERLSQRAGTLSGGQQQMLAIARALIGNPELLMLDEPSLGLAPIITKQVFDILRRICDSGVAVLLVEQNALAALGLADRAYVMSRGRMVLEGSGRELREDERIRHAYLSVTGA